MEMKGTGTALVKVLHVYKNDAYLFLAREVKEIKESIKQLLVYVLADILRELRSRSFPFRVLLLPFRLEQLPACFISLDGSILFSVGNVIPPTARHAAMAKINFLEQFKDKSDKDITVASTRHSAPL
jgi:hypothetical protein